jgi:predicted nucleic acid-binding Zn finger protein
MKQTVSKQLAKEEENNKKNRREDKGRVLALSRYVYRLQGKDTYSVKSETMDSRYYFVRFNYSFTGGFCSCKDYESNRSEKCKHPYAVEYGIRFNTIKEVEHLPEEVRNAKKTAERNYSS